MASLNIFCENIKGERTVNQSTKSTHLAFKCSGCYNCTYVVKTVASALFSVDSNLHCARAGPVRDKAHCTQVHISLGLV